MKILPVLVLIGLVARAAAAQEGETVPIAIPVQGIKAG